MVLDSAGEVSMHRNKKVNGVIMALLIKCITILTGASAA